MPPINQKLFSHQLLCYTYNLAYALYMRYRLSLMTARATYNLGNAQLLVECITFAIQVC